MGRAVLGFSAGLIGECGSVRELWDFGESTPAGPAFRARVALEFAVAVVFVLFFGLGISRACSFGTFSLSSADAISSLPKIRSQAVAACRGSNTPFPLG